MYKLYLKQPNSLLDEDPLEANIIDTLGLAINKDPSMQFRIIKSTVIDNQPTDEIYRIIKSYEDYQKYLEDFELRNMSIIELKDKILRR